MTDVCELICEVDFAILQALSEILAFDFLGVFPFESLFAYWLKKYFVSSLKKKIKPVVSVIKATTHLKKFAFFWGHTDLKI